MSLPAAPSVLLQAGFIGLSVVMAAFLAWFTQRRALAAAWLVLTGALSLSGVFESFTPPLLPLLLFPALFAVTTLAWRSSWHQHSLRLLVGFQAFRIVVELLIHRAVTEGVAPPQFTWTGLNWDVASGVLALLLLPFADRLPRYALHLFNAIGWGLLLNVMVVAVLSMPTPLQQLHPDNIWIGFFPFTWLPLILVVAAWTGHVVLLKKLVATSA